MIMKRFLFLLAIATLDPLVGNAQLPRAFGAKVAYSSSRQVFDYSLISVDQLRRPSVNAAVFAEWFDGEPFSMVFQCEYAQRGVGMRFGITSGSSPEIIRFETQYSHVDYLSFPVFVKMYVLKSVVSPYVLAGGRADFRIGYASYKHLLDTAYEQFSKTIFGATCGAGLEIADLPIMLEVRYNFDLKDSYKTPGLRVTNNSIDIWLGIAFTT